MKNIPYFKCVIYIIYKLNIILISFDRVISLIMYQISTNRVQLTDLKKLLKYLLYNLIGQTINLAGFIYFFILLLFSRRANELRLTYGEPQTDSDTFEHILNVTTHNDALLAYYYLDSDNKVCEIFADVNARFWYGNLKNVRDFVQFTRFYGQVSLHNLSNR